MYMYMCMCILDDIRGENVYSLHAMLQTYTWWFSCVDNIFLWTCYTFGKGSCLKQWIIWESGVIPRNEKVPVGVLLPLVSRLPLEMHLSCIQSNNLTGTNRSVVLNPSYWRMSPQFAWNMQWFTLLYPNSIVKAKYKTFYILRQVYAFLLHSVLKLTLMRRQWHKICLIINASWVVNFL